MSNDYNNRIERLIKIERDTQIKEVLRGCSYADRSLIIAAALKKLYEQSEEYIQQNHIGSAILTFNRIAALEDYLSFIENKLSSRKVSN